MCLAPEFWHSAPQRLAERLKNGLSVERAEVDLKHYHSTVYPIAQETACFINEHWSDEQKSKLSEDAQAALKLCLQYRNET